MTQFSLCRVRHEDALVCRIQTDLGADTAYLLCAPVVRQSEWSIPIPMLHIPFEFDGEAYLILMSQMLALPTASLGPVVGFAGAVRDEIVRAVDLLVVGF
ncbi:CcdB family protein [Roseovarius sp. S1116L3]|uniref:CcdB family protein n=1 Tax=Roseovarius roseus TaxID=3342636 RepID=UPI00372CC137